MAFKEVLQKDLRAQVEKVRRFVEQQQVRLVEQECRELHAGLPTAGELGDGAFEVRPFEFELARDFATLPVGFTAVAHEKLERGFIGQKRIVLTEIAQAQARVANDFAAVEFFFAEENAEQGAFPGAVSANKAHFDVIANGCFGIVEQDLIAIAFAGAGDL